MVNQQLLDYIRSRKSSGYSNQVLYNYLAQKGYKPDDIREAMGEAAKPKEAGFSFGKIKIDQKMMMVYVIAGIVFLNLLVISIWYFTRPVCGNGLLEEGETEATCCLDAGCSAGDQKCVNGMCQDPTCGRCQHLETHVCKSYKCCTDTDCNDNSRDTTDSCINPSSTNSKCYYTSQAVISDEGTTVDVSPDRAVRFKSNAIEYTLSVDDVSSSSATVSVSSVPKTVNLKVNQPQPVDINGDRIDDFSLAIVAITNGEIGLRISEISYECFNDKDCNDNDPKTTDTCINPGTPEASCAHSIADECINASGCDDGDSSTTDECKGTPKKCVHISISQCSSNDGFCPPGCAYANDNDCTLSLSNCKVSFQCFIDASKTCAESNVSFSASSLIDGINTSTTTYMELQGGNGTKCAYYERTDAISALFTDEKKQKMLDSGTPFEQIKVLEQSYNASIQSNIDEDMTCIFTKSDLTAMLIRWNGGIFDEDDYDLGECS